MKKLIMLSLAVSMNCSANSSDLINLGTLNKVSNVINALSPQNKNIRPMAYGVDISKVHANTSIQPEFEYEYQAIEQYGLNGYRAISACSDKFYSKMDGIYGSSDKGAELFQVAKLNISKCVTQTLQNYPKIPTNKRIHIIREDEIDLSNRLPIGNPHTSNSHYKQILKSCTKYNGRTKNDDRSSEQIKYDIEFCVKQAE